MGKRLRAKSITENHLQVGLFMGIMIFLTLVGAAATLVTPVMLDHWMKDADTITSERLLLLFGLLLFSMLLQILLVQIRERFAKQYNIHNFETYLKIYLDMQYDEMINKGPTHFIERIQIAVNSLYSFMTGGNVQIWSSVIILSVILCMAFMNHILSGLILLGMIPINYLGYKLLNQELARRSEILQRENASGFQKVLSYVRQVDYLKQCSQYQALLGQMHPAMEQIYGSMMDINIFAGSVSQLLLSINEIAKISIMVLCVCQFNGTADSSFMLILMAILLPIYFSNLSTITRLNLDKQGMVAAQKFIREMKEKKEESGTLPCEKIEELEFDLHRIKVGNTVLNREVQGSFQRGDVIWVKGKSGSGKSSLVKLLPGFWQSSGIKINGVDIAAYTKQSLREHICYMSQEVPIINGTLRENLFFNRAWDREKEEAFQKEEILECFKGKLDMGGFIEESGANLSGGEKQRIAIARMLQEDADILILDEITSNIDKESAVKILERVFQDREKKIIFIISHDELPGKYANRSLEIGEPLRGLFAELGACKELPPEAAEVQEKIKGLQDFITEHYYTCTKEILLDLGQMYVGDPRFLQNIDKAGGAGTAAFVKQAIDIYCARI